MKSIVKRCMAFMMALLLAGGIVLNFSGIVFAAENGRLGDYRYRIIYGTYIEIVDYDGSAQSVNIPSELTVEGVSYPVKSIGVSAFQGSSSLTSINIPDGVTSIGQSAFQGGSSLTSINIPDSVTSIGNFAFNGCSSLASINIPEGVTSIEGGAFSDCSSLTSIHIPEGVTSIARQTFEGCSSLAGIHIPEGVTSIGDWAFNGCSSLAGIHIPEGVTSIGGWAFAGCSSLASIHIPEGVTSIGDWAFGGCSSLASINIPEGMTSIRSSIFADCSSLASINIPEGVTSIGYRAFLNCSSLTSIHIPDNVTSIGGSAFYGCSSLASINIPEGVTSIAWQTFEGCSSLAGIHIPEGVTSIEDFAFDGCSSLASIHIPEGVTSIGSCTFQGCSSLVSINIPYSVASIGSYAFNGCSILTIYGSKDSYAETYAKDHNIPFKIAGVGDSESPGSVGRKKVSYINSVDFDHIILDALPYGFDESKVSIESLKPYVGRYAYIEFDTSIDRKVIGVQGVESSIGTITEYVELDSSEIEIDHKKYPVGNKNIYIIDGRNDRILYHTINDKIVGVEFLKTSIGYYHGMTENGEGIHIAVSTKEYDINSASCISDNIKNGRPVVFSVGTKNNSDKWSPFLFEMQELQGTPSVWVYVSDDTFSTEIGQELDLYCALHIGDYVIRDWEKPSFAIGNEKLVSLSDYEQTDLGYHCKIKGVSVGQTTLTITDTETGAHQSFPITVKEKSETMSYTCRINEVPDYTIESGWDKGLQTNIFIM